MEIWNNSICVCVFVLIWKMLSKYSMQLSPESLQWPLLGWFLHISENIHMLAKCCQLLKVPLPFSNFLDGALKENEPITLKQYKNSAKYVLPLGQDWDYIQRPHHQKTLLRRALHNCQVIMSLEFHTLTSIKRLWGVKGRVEFYFNYINHALWSNIRGIGIIICIMIMLMLMMMIIDDNDYVIDSDDADDN